IARGLSPGQLSRLRSLSGGNGGIGLAESASLSIVRLGHGRDHRGAANRAQRLARGRLFLWDRWHRAGDSDTGPKVRLAGHALPEFFHSALWCCCGDRLRYDHEWILFVLEL